jgi:dolichol-phosphate mannosyltransferase
MATPNIKKTIVIIPTYNESENIADIIKAVFQLPVVIDVLIVDDSSPDGTAGIVKELQVQYNSQEQKLFLLQRKGKMGLGTAYIAGFKYCLAHDYDYIMQMDADFSHNPNDLPALLESCDSWGSGLAIGSRYATGVNVVNWPIGRVLLSYSASFYVRLITGIPIHDTTAGFVCYRREVLESIDLETVRFVGYAFQIEMKFLTWKYGFKIAEVPIVFTDRTRGQSKLSSGIFKEAFFGVVQMKMQSYFKKYIPLNQNV